MNRYKRIVDFILRRKPKPRVAIRLKNFKYENIHPNVRAYTENMEVNVKNFPLPPITLTELDLMKSEPRYVEIVNALKLRLRLVLRIFF